MNHIWEEVEEAVIVAAIAGRMDNIPLYMLTSRLWKLEREYGYNKLLLEQILLEYYGENV